MARTKVALRSVLPPLVVVVPLLLLAALGTHGRQLLAEPASLASDGVSPRESDAGTILQVWRRSAVSGDGSCEQSYGVLPCTTTALGNLFLLLVYGYLMFLAATYMSNGSELLLEILGPGIIGGLFLPALGALPDAILILGKPARSPAFLSSSSSDRSVAWVRTF